MSMLLAIYAHVLLAVKVADVLLVHWAAVRGPGGDGFILRHDNDVSSKARMNGEDAVLQQLQ